MPIQVKSNRLTRFLNRYFDEWIILDPEELANVMLRPRRKNFGVLRATLDTATFTFTATNTGEVVADVNVFLTGSNAFSIVDGGGDQTIAKNNGTLSITIEFTPPHNNSGAPFEGDLVVSCPRCPGGGDSVHLTGIGLSPAAISYTVDGIETTSFNFDTLAPVEENGFIVGEVSPTVEVRIYNNGQQGTGDMTITYTGDVSNFDLTAAPEPGINPIPAGGHQKAFIFFIPTEPFGQKTMMINVNLPGIPEEQQPPPFTLTGTARMPPTADIPEEEYDYGPVNV